MGSPGGKSFPDTGVCTLQLATLQVELPTQTVTLMAFNAHYNLYGKEPENGNSLITGFTSDRIGKCVGKYCLASGLLSDLCDAYLTQITDATQRSAWSPH